MSFRIFLLVILWTPKVSAAQIQNKIKYVKNLKQEARIQINRIIKTMIWKIGYLQMSLNCTR